jgi:hypothetical protein
MLIRSLVAFVPCRSGAGERGRRRRSFGQSGVPDGRTWGVGGSQGDVFDRVEHGTAVFQGGVKIHYASLGKGRSSS